MARRVYGDTIRGGASDAPRSLNIGDEAIVVETTLPEGWGAFPPIPVVIAVAALAERATRSAVAAAVPTLAAEPSILYRDRRSGRSGSAGDRVIAELLLGKAGGRARGVVVPPDWGAAARSGRQGGPDRAAGSRWLISNGPGATTDRASRPIWAAAAYAGRRRWLLARLAAVGAGAGAMADLAAPLRLDLIVIAGSYLGQQLVIATPDVIAAELAWLVLAEPAAADELSGPWEDATVQRATELNLGARLPRQLEPRVAARLNEAERTIGADLVERLRLRLGIP